MVSPQGKIKMQRKISLIHDNNLKHWVFIIVYKFPT